MNPGILNKKKPHKVKGRQYMTFMVITDATKGAKTFRVPKILRFPILALLVFGLIQVGLFYQHSVEMEEELALMNLQRQEVAIDNYSKELELTQLNEELLVAKANAVEELVDAQELAVMLATKLNELEEQNNENDEKIEIIDDNLGNSEDDNTSEEDKTLQDESSESEDVSMIDSDIEPQAGEAFVMKSAPTIQALDSYSNIDAIGDDFSMYNLSDGPIAPNQGGLPVDITYDNYDLIDFDEEVEELEAYLENALSKVDIEEERFIELAEQLEEMIPYVEAYPSVLPIQDTYITSQFGYRRNPFGYRSTEFHTGVDLKASYEPVYATGAGTVIESKYLSGYGYTVIIDHGYGIMTKYAHNSKLYVSVGDEVVRGDKISKSGNSGRSTGPHLHYEILVDGEPVNPLDYIYEEGEE